LRLSARIVPKSITGQIIGLVVIAVTLGVALTTATLQVVDTAGPRDGPGVVAGRLAAIAQLAQAARAPDDIDSLVASSRRAGLEVELAETGEPSEPQSAVDTKPPFATAVTQVLRNYWRIPAADGIAGSATDPDRTVTVWLDGGRKLVFHHLRERAPPRFVVAPALLVISITGFFIVLLSIYSVRAIIVPLSSMASAAQAFGNTPGQPALSEAGPREILQVARALNEMGARIHALVEARTRMLAAISHDLRTPLTRLRLRAERLGHGEGPDESQREGMLSDIARISDMLGETLVYLRDGASSEAEQRADLPSLLQTISAEFADVGHAVTYEGPNRLACTCRPGALTRAVTNIVENGTKYGTIVTVKLRKADADTVAIEISDDGAGIPADLRERVFEPFFKGDRGRAAAEEAGFGLGLSIAHDIVKGHGGRIGLSDRQPHGLRVSILLPLGG
jgi:signal transduction histidine kinase